MITVGAGIGTLGSTFNAFATVIASNAAGVPFTSGLLLRVFILLVCLAAGILYVMRYAARVKVNPDLSVVAAQREDNVTLFLKGSAPGAPPPEFTRVREIILALFGLTFVMMLYGVIAPGWLVGRDVGPLPRDGDPDLLRRQVLVRRPDSTSTPSSTPSSTAPATFSGVALIIGVARARPSSWSWMPARSPTPSYTRWPRSLAGFGNVALR